MYSHVDTYNALFDFYFFIFLCYFFRTIIKTKKNQDHGKISLFVAKTFYCA
jgi:hypothetical protein